MTKPLLQKLLGCGVQEWDVETNSDVGAQRRSGHVFLQMRAQILITQPQHLIGESNGNVIAFFVRDYAEAQQRLWDGPLMQRRNPQRNFLPSTRGWQIFHGHGKTLLLPSISAEQRKEKEAYAIQQQKHSQTIVRQCHLALRPPPPLLLPTPKTTSKPLLNPQKLERTQNNISPLRHSLEILHLFAPSFAITHMLFPLDGPPKRHPLACFHNTRFLRQLTTFHLHLYE